jgi:CheY-like chemotaxis protein
VSEDGRPVVEDVTHVAWRAPQVLVVDDHLDTRELLACALEIAGYGVLLAETGPEAIGMAHQYHPAAVVMDIYMPVMDGIEATRAIRQDPALAHMPVVAHTARPGGLVGLEHLFDAICPKPCPPDRLVDMVGAWIHAKGGGDQAGERP